MAAVWKKFTQSFDAALEDEYREYRISLDRRGMLILLWSGTIAIALGSIGSWIVLDITTMRWPAVAAQCALVASLVASLYRDQRARFKSQFDRDALRLLIMMALCGSVMLAVAKEERVFIIATLFLGIVMLAGSTPFPFKVYSLGVTALFTGYLVPVLARGLWLRPEFIASTGLMGIATLSTIVASRGFDKTRREGFLTLRANEQEKRWSNKLLASILPERLTSRLEEAARQGTAVVERHDDVAVIFVDIVGFTPLAASMTPEQVVEMLDEIFRRFDLVVEATGAEKIKTIGDSYMAVFGLAGTEGDPAIVGAETALDLREAIQRYTTLKNLPLQVRIGLHCGPVVAGIIGRSRLHFDLWGETVNTAARMESHGLAGEVHISAAVARRIAPFYVLESRGVIGVKGLGNLETFILRAPRLLNPR